MLGLSSISDTLAKIDLVEMDAMSMTPPQTTNQRFRTDDKCNLGIVNFRHCGGTLDMPVMGAVDTIPTQLIPFNKAMSAKTHDGALHFFIDDYQFERLWNSPEKYLDLIKQFDAVLTPDFSLYMDMPLPMQQWNEYRRRALGNYWQRNGCKVIPTLSWSDERSYGFCFEDLPNHAVYAVSTVGVTRNKPSQELFQKGLCEAISVLDPACLLVYGGKHDFDFMGVKTVEYQRNTSFGGH